MKFKRKPILVAALLVAAFLAAGFGVPCAAQSDSQAAARLRFRLISWDSVVRDLEFLDGEGKAIPVLLLPNVRSPFYIYTGPGPVVFGKTVAGLDGKPVFQSAASVPLSEFKERTLLLFSEKRRTPGQFKVAAFDDSDAALPAGGYRFCNFTPYPLAIRCGDAISSVASEQSALVKGNTTDSPEIMPVEVQAKRGEDYVRVYANRWPYGKTTRTLVFMFFDPERQGFELKRIHEDSAAIAIPRKTPPR